MQGLVRPHAGTLDASEPLSAGPSLLISRPRMMLVAADHRLAWATKALPEGAADPSQLQTAALGGGTAPALCLDAKGPPTEMSQSSGPWGWVGRPRVTRDRQGGWSQLDCPARAFAYVCPEDGRWQHRCVSFQHQGYEGGSGLTEELVPKSGPSGVRPQCPLWMLVKPCSRPARPGQQGKEAGAPARRQAADLDGAEGEGWQPQARRLQV